MEIKFSKERIRAAGITAAHVELDSIRILEGKFSCPGENWDQNSEEMILNIPGNFEFNEKTSQLSFRKKFSIIYSGKKKEIISALYEVIYTLNGNPPPEDVKDLFFSSFCEVNSIMHVWPYWREFVDNCFERFNVIHKPIPFLRISVLDEVVKKTNKPNEIKKNKTVTPKTKSKNTK